MTATEPARPADRRPQAADDELLHRLRGRLDDAGLRGSVLVRELGTGIQLGLDPDVRYPAASLVKVPLAIATLDRIRIGELDAAARVEVPGGRPDTPGPFGLSRFRHPAQVAIEDLVYLSTSLSDNTAADALFALTSPARVHRTLAAYGLAGISVRHTLAELTETPVERFEPADRDLAHRLAHSAGTAGPGHRLPQLDVTRANAGSARAFVDLLAALWAPSSIDPAVCARVRELMAGTAQRQRLAPDFTSDTVRWSSRTGTLLNLRHEIGVAEHADGAAFAVAVLTESRIPAAQQPGAEAVMGAVARSLHDHLRSIRPAR